MSTGDSGSGQSPPVALQSQGAYGKYFLINVPDFNGGLGPYGPMHSYLRLGAIESPMYVASPSAPKPTGEDLAAQVTSFIDDDRTREGCPGYIPPAERQAETAVLHTKGGWRDHTDGNRVTTTRGDKVEVIRGNYRMVVMCRKDGELDVGGWDISGGHVGESGITYDGSNVIEYTTQEYGGTWSVVEHTRKGHVHSAYHGKVFNYYCGEIVEDITGSEAPTALQPNPVVSQTTYALSITSNTGSMACPVPTMTDSTYALAMSSTTVAGTITSATTTTGDIVDTTSALAMKSTTSAVEMTSTTKVVSSTSTTEATSLVDTTISPNIMSTTIGNSLSTIIGNETEIIVGNMLEVTVGGEESITTGAVMDLTLGLLLDICIAGKIEIDIGPRVKVNATSTTDVDVEKNKITVSKNGVATSETDLSQTYTRISNLVNFL